MQKQFFLLGRNASQYSFSPTYFQEKFKKLERPNYQYTALDLASIELLPSKLKQFPHLVGFNVTIPYKTEIIPFLDELDVAAEEIGAVNTVKRLPNGKLKGFNTDYIGFWNTLKIHLTANQKKAKSLILGTGGAAKAVGYALQKNNIAFSLVSRRRSSETLGYDQLTKAIIQSHLILVNTTPLGTYPNLAELPDIPYTFLTKNHLGYDLIYRPAKTSFMQKCVQHQAKALNGYSMLLEQAEKSWEIWMA